MRPFVISVLVLMFLLPATAAMARRDTGPPEWTFDDVADLADWQDHHDLAPDPRILKVKDLNGLERTVLRLDSTGENAYIYPGGSVPSWEPFNGYDYRTLYMGLRVQETDIWQVDYITSRDSEYSEGRSRSFEVEAAPDFIDLELDMEWENMIRGFRIHLGTNKNKVTEIDYLSLRAPVAPSQTPRRLATTWGRIKDLF